MSISENIKARRINAGLSQTALAKRVGVNPSMITQIERGTKAVSFALAVDIAAVFQCTLDDLAYDTEKHNS